MRLPTLDVEPVAARYALFSGYGIHPVMSTENEARGFS